MCRDYDPSFDEIFPCEVCGKLVDDCICPECKVCGTQGDPACYDLTREGHGMVRNGEQLVSIEAYNTFLAEVLKQDKESDTAEAERLQWEKDHAEEIKKAITWTPEDYGWGEL